MKRWRKFYKIAKMGWYTIQNKIRIMRTIEHYTKLVWNVEVTWYLFKGLHSAFQVESETKTWKPQDRIHHNYLGASHAKKRNNLWTKFQTQIVRPSFDIDVDIKEHNVIHAVKNLPSFSLFCDSTSFLSYGKIRGTPRRWGSRCRAEGCISSSPPN